MDINSLFDSLSRSAFRLEVLPSYASDLAKPGYAAFQESGFLPDDHNQAWRDELRGATLRGLTYQRLRLFSEPLTEYERYEQAAFVQNAEAGEEIRAVPREQFPAAQDFWFLDDRWIALMRYDSAGEFLGADAHEASDEERATATRWIRVFEELGRDVSEFR